MIACKTLYDLTFCYFYLAFMRYILPFPHLLYPRWSPGEFLHTPCICIVQSVYTDSAFCLDYVSLPQKGLSEHHWKLQLGTVIIHILLDPSRGKLMFSFFNVILNTFYVLFDILEYLYFLAYLCQWERSFMREGGIIWLLFSLIYHKHLSKCLSHRRSLEHICWPPYPKFTYN